MSQRNLGVLGASAKRVRAKRTAGAFCQVVPAGQPPTERLDVAEGEARTSESECVVCDRIWAGLAILAAAAVGLIAFDMFTGYQISNWLSTRLPARLTGAAEGDDDSDA
jgi:hypothetical protein